MKAIVCLKYGGPDVLSVRQVDLPVMKDNEIMVKIHAASVTAAHCAMREGKPYFARLFVGLFKPSNEIPGTDFSGVIVKVGKNVKQYNEGDEIYAASDLKGSSYAEYICMPENDAIAKKPVNMSFEEAASVIDGAVTALSFLRDSAKLTTGQSILVNGASGGIGTFAIQLAKYYGAEVTGVCSTKNVELVQSLGADYVIDYTKDNFTLNNKQYDVIFDTVGKLSFGDCKKSLKPKGLFLTPVLSMSVLFQMLSTSLFSDKKVIFSATGLRNANEKIKDLNFLRELIEVGKIKTIIDKVYPLDDAAAAHSYVEKGHKVGNVVLKVT